MLPPRHRLRTAADFSAVVRGSGGARSGGRLLVVHGRLGTPPAKVGFVVSKGVGGAVVRNRTKRVLRHLVAARLTRLPAQCHLVVRANPPAASATTPDLAAELDRSLDAVLRRLDVTSGPPARVRS